ncbi:MAG: hypothetical protein VB858_03095, partial [Planctomycetaceae bacterium]
MKVTDNGTRVGTLTVEPHGLFGLHRGAPSVNIAQDSGEGLLKINFTKNGNFDVAPGKYQFVLHGTGVTQYRKNAAAVIRAEAELQRITTLTAALKSAAATAGDAVKAAQATLEQARKDAAAAKPDPGARVQQAAAALKAATAQAQATADEVTRVEAAHVALKSR